MPAASSAARIRRFRRWMIWREQPATSAASTVEYQNSARAVSWTALGSGASARSRSIRNRPRAAELGAESATGMSCSLRLGARRYRRMDVSSLSMTREANVWTDALSLSNFGQRARNVKTSWLSTSSRSSTPSPQRRTNAFAFRPARSWTTGSAWSRVRSTTAASFQFDFHGEGQAMPDLEFADLAGVNVAHVGEELGDLRQIGRAHV